MESDGWVYIHKCFRDDNEEDKSLHHEFKIFQEKHKACEYLMSEYLTNEHLHPINDFLNREQVIKNKIIDHICQNDCSVFEWEWKRRGNYDVYWVENMEDGEFSFYGAENEIKMKKLVKLFYDGDIK